MTAPLLEIVRLDVGRGGTTALAGLDLHVGVGEVVALLGGNGAGKTTLLRAIAGLQSISAGSIRLAGTSLAALNVEWRAKLGIAYCPANRRVFPGLTVRENLVVGSREGRRERTARLAAVLQLLPQLAPHADRRAWQLSGGQQQLLAVGRAMMARPRLLLLDEPSSGLAPRLASEIMQHVRRFADAGAGVLLAEQNPRLALAVADRVALLQRGRLLAVGGVAEFADRADLGELFLG